MSFGVRYRYVALDGSVVREGRTWTPTESVWLAEGGKFRKFKLMHPRDKGFDDEEQVFVYKEFA